MKKTLLELVRSILNDMDSEDVNSIADSVEAQQVASILEDTYFNLIVPREIPEHKEIFRLTSLSDITKPTHFTYPSDVKSIDKVFYNVSTDGGMNYKEIYWLDPIDFLEHQPTSGTSVVVGATSLYINSDRMPSYYTSFDDGIIVMDSYDVDVDTTLTEAKTRAYGQKFPSFDAASDSFVPDMDDVMFPLLLAEAKSVCFSLLKSGADPKIEQHARRLRYLTQNDMHKTKLAEKRPKYGR